MSISRISLYCTLPRVFVNETIPTSEVWLRDITFERGKHYLVEAPSGTGKSSLCAYIYGNRSDYEGRIEFDGRDIRNFKIAEWQKLRREQLAYLPQELDLFPELTALENIALKNNLTGHKTTVEIEAMLEALGIEDRTHYPVGKMSIGQQQRVAIIRALCQPFSFLLIDEPVSHLDAKNNAIAAGMISEEARRQGAAVISTSVGNRIGIEPDELLHL